MLQRAGHRLPFYACSLFPHYLEDLRVRQSVEQYIPFGILESNPMYKIISIHDIDSSKLKTYYALMSEDRKTEIDRIHLEKDKIQSICGEMLAKEMISEKKGIPVTDIHLVKDENGKPFARDIDIEFSISHSKDHVICAVSETPVGVDMEYMRDIKASLIHYVCTENELQYVQDSIPRFFEIWTAKEAYFKCIGTGIKDLKSIDVLEKNRKEHLTTFTYKDYVINIYQE